MNERRPLPSSLEVALGALLHDIGKFMQRAVGDVEALPDVVRNRASDVLPSFDGRHTHFHALFSDAFFETCVDAHPLPDELDGRWVRDCAVFHHKPLQDGAATPNGAVTLLVTEADRIAAAMERKRRDEAAESSPDAKVRERYRRTRLVVLPARVRLPGLPRAEEAYYRVGDLTADTLLDLQRTAQDDEAVAQYRTAWPAFVHDYAAMADRTRHSAQAYAEGLLSLSERWCWSIPSSTIDDPDVSLHDHGRVAAAVAACLHRHHESCKDLKDEAAIKNRDRPKFRLLAGDLSGIQAALFRLQSEGVRGLARLLRGRSFRMQLVTEAAARRACEMFGLSVLNIIQLAGGRFLVLVPETGGTAALDHLAALREEVDGWMRRQYVGDLAFNLSLTEALSAADLIHRLPHVYAQIAHGAEAAKLRPLSTQPFGVVDLPFDPELGVCGSCGVRPAARRGALDKQPRCLACDAETELGRRLAKADALAVDRSAAEDSILGLRFDVLARDQTTASAQGWRRRGTPLAVASPRPTASSKPMCRSTRLAPSKTRISPERGLNGEMERRPRKVT